MSSAMEKAYMAGTSEGPNRGRAMGGPDGTDLPPRGQVIQDQFPTPLDGSKGRFDEDWSRGTSPLRGPTITGPSAIGRAGH